MTDDGAVGPRRPRTSVDRRGGEAACHRILFIENSVGLGGSTMSLCDIVNHLDDRAYRPSIVFSRRRQQEYFLRSAAAGCSTVSRIETMVIECRSSLKSSPLAQRLLGSSRLPAAVRHLVSWLASLLDMLLGILPYAVRLYRFARRKSVDLLHHNNGFDIAAILVARWLGVPLIAYQRGDEWNSIVVRWLSRFVDLYLANSGATRQSLLSIGVPSNKIEVLYPPVDLARFDCRVDAWRQRQEFGVGRFDPCFGIVGVLVDWKGHRTFLEAAQSVLCAIPRARAFVIGEVPDEDTAYRNELMGLARALGIVDRVVFTGFRHDVPELLQMLDVVVHASVRPEPFGRVIVEAMAMKKPVVATGAGGPLEIIQDGRNGFLVPPGHPQALAERLVTLLTDPELALKLGEQAHRDARARFSLTSHLEKLQAVYALLVGTGRRPPARHRRQSEGFHVSNAK